jgi:hypothetical protein
MTYYWIPACAGMTGEILVWQAEGIELYSLGLLDSKPTILINTQTVFNLIGMIPEDILEHLYFFIRSCIGEP